MSTAVAIISSIAGAATVVLMIALIRRCIVVKKKMKKKIIKKVLEEMKRKRETQACNALDEVAIEIGPVEKFLNEILNEKPMRFSSEQLAACTRNYSSELGSGGYGVVYRGDLPNGLPVAVKVLKVSMNKKVQEGFMAEIGTIGRTYHVHLVRLYGFCFDRDTKALVYEFLENGSLEKYLYGDDEEEAGKAAPPRRLEWKTLHGIAVGTAKGIRYLHEECQQRIVHYDIKPANILLTGDFTPKVADFGLARLGERENTHMSLTGGGRGTPGYGRRAWDARVRGAGAVDGVAGDGEVRRVQLRDGAVRDPGPAAQLRPVPWREQGVVPEVGVGEVRAGGDRPSRVLLRRRRRDGDGGGGKGEGGDDVQGGAVVRAVPAGGATDDEQRGADAGGGDGNRPAGEPLPLRHGQQQQRRL